MAGDVRARMIESAVTLLARQGLQGTSFSEVLELADAPRGSVYHHFPGGKEQLIGAAIDLTSARLDEVLDRMAGSNAEEVTAHYLRIWRAVLTRSQYQAGCAVLAVTVATDSADLLDRTAAVFRGWRGRLSELLRQGGLSPVDATRFAAMLVAATEGAVVISRSERSMEAFDLVSEQLVDQVRRLATGS
jgi:TetR/AcrR family transcriptional regulator, lmrAB and yxaGH operons repressor